MMSGKERREEILKRLSSTQKPLSGTYLAEQFDVSRQVIVQDMALIRAQGREIISTNRGYLVQTPSKKTRILKVLHDNDQMTDELQTIVDLGGVVEDVSVNHKVYGVIQADLKISSRLDVHRFMGDIQSGKSAPLKEVTSGYHCHTISADSEETLDFIEKELENKGYLCNRI